MAQYCIAICSCSHVSRVENDEYLHLNRLSKRPSYSVAWVIFLHITLGTVIDQGKVLGQL